MESRPLPGRLRLPLQTGATALFYVQLGVFGLAVFAAVVPLFAYTAPLGILTIGVVLVAVIALAIGISSLVYGWRERPSDIVLDDAGFEIAGGPARGRWAWQDVARGAVKLERATGRFTRLVLGERVLATVTVQERSGALGGETVDALVAGERASFEAVADVIDRWPRPGEPRPVPAPDPAVVLLRCAGCGAPLVPAADDAVDCPACGRSNPVPEPVREALRDAAELDRERRDAARELPELVHQPPARAVSVLGALAAVAIIAAVPVCSTAMLLRIVDHPALFHAAALAIPALALAWLALSFLAAGACANRAALRAVVLGLRARAPARPGAPPCCRVCNAGLRQTPSLLVRCEYCGADNVLLVDLASDLGEARLAGVDLLDVLEHRRAARLRRYFVLGVRALVVIAVALLLQA